MLADLFWMDVVKKHKAVSTVQKNFGNKAVEQRIDLGSVATLVDSYISNQIKDLIDPDKYPLLFNTISEPYEGNENNIGCITMQCDKKGIKEECLSKIKLGGQQSFSVVMQKPHNDLELYEWTKGISSSLLRGATTEESSFDWGFCTLDLKEPGMPLSAKERTKWIKDFMPTLQKQGVNNLCVYVPSTEAADSYNIDGKKIYFVPLTNHDMDALHSRIDDNIDLFRQNYNDDVVGSNFGPIVVKDTVFGEGENASHVFQDGANIKNIDSTAKQMVNEVIERVKIAMEGINRSEMGVVSPDFSFSEPHPSIEV